jgi:broad specificity phosphatase PhoE
VADPSDAVTIDGLELPAHLAATLVLVRHGESTYVAEGRFQGRLDPPLSELGRRQAALVAERLAHRDERTPLPIPIGLPLRVWHSPLSRAAETAAIIADHQPGAVQADADDRLTEIAQGDWEGQPMAVVKTRWANELAAWRTTPTLHHAPGGESLIDAAARVRAALADIVAGFTEGQAASAGDGLALAYDPVPGYTTVAANSDAPPEPWGLIVAHDGIFRLTLITLLGLPLERFWSFPFNLASITVVTLHGGVAGLRAHNLSDHLEPLADEDRSAQESRGERRGAL